MNYHRQCILKKGTTITVSWIPEEFAEKGKEVDLKNEGVWEKGWVVSEVGTRLPTHFVIDRSQDYSKFKTRTDI